MPIIKLQSSDGKIFEADKEIANCCGLIRNLIDDLGIEDDQDTVIPLPQITSNILEKVIAFAEYHKNDPPPTEDNIEDKEKCLDDVCTWDVDFLKVDQATLFEYITAANYLDIKMLLSVTCKTVAKMIKGKSPEDIVKTFSLKKPKE